MNPIWGPIAGAFIVFMMLAFVGIWVWAWLPYHKRNFGEMARVPMQDQDSGFDAAITSGDHP